MADYSFDLQRIFLGDLPALFLLEVVFRTVILYVFALAALRFMGKRSTGQLTAVDVILIVALGSAVGDPMFYPNVPLLHGMLVISLVIGLQRTAILLANDHRRVEKALKGSPARMVVDGAFDLDTKKNSELSRAEVFAMLREQGYTNLGQVERLYIETDGTSSHYAFPEGQSQPGLPLTPPWELVAPEQVETEHDLAQTDLMGCGYCGYVLELASENTIPPCPRCHHKDWVVASRPEGPPSG